MKKYAVRRVRNRRAWAVRFLLIALAVFLSLKVVQLYGQIREKQQDLSTLNKLIQEQTAENEGYENGLEEESLQKEAYSKDYVHPGEQIYQSEVG